MTSSRSQPVTRYDGACFSATDDRLAVEEPLEIRVNDGPLAITMRTPGHDRELAAGFCITEGVVRDPDEIESVEPCGEATFGNIIVATLTQDALARRAAQIAHARRDTYLSSSCGLCGKQTLDRIAQDVPPITGRFSVSRAVLDTLPSTMRKTQTTFDQTGGLHAAGLFTPDGTLRVVREDIGRHNAVDKVIGWAALLGTWPIEAGVLLVSGRASFEIMQKAAMAGIAVVCAVSAPSSLAVDFAIRLNMTLIGFLRPGRMNLYHDAGRMVD